MSINTADYSLFGKVKVSGSDAVSVLHNILTNDIKKLPPGEHCPAALLTNTGKILIYMEVYRFENFLILVIENDSAAKAIALLDKYIITEDVQLEDVTSSYSYFQTFDQPFKKFLIPKTETEKGVRENKLKLFTLKDCEAFRVTAGFPLYGVDMDENTILSETGLDAISVSETKGCYPGQEVVARIQTYKGLTKKIRKISLGGTAVPKPGDKIYAEDGTTNIGWVSSAVFAPSIKKIAGLGYLLKGYFQEPMKIKVQSAGKWIDGVTL